MAVEIKIRLENFDKLREAFRKFPQKALPEFKYAIQKSILQIENAAKREAPVGKTAGGGTLRQSISSRMDSNVRGLIEVGVNYAAYVHEGTAPHLIRPRIKMVLANRYENIIFGKLVRHPGTRANPFMQRAVDKSLGNVNANFLKAMENVLKSLT